MQKWVGPVLAVAAFSLLAAAWWNGTFDKVLVIGGLNARPCVQFYYGQTLCGDAARDFCTEYDPYYQDGEVCDAADVTGSMLRPGWRQLLGL